MLLKIMNNLNWKIKRLSLMSPMEILFRIKDSAKSLIGKHMPGPNVPVVRIGAPVFNHVLPDDEIVSADIERDWTRAEDLLNHKFTFFSFQSVEFGRELDWNKDYKNNLTAPANSIGKLIDYRRFELVGDIKYIWELNRHQHLITLAKTYKLTGKEEYRQEVWSQVRSWLEQNPYLMGVNWASSLELAIRLISWSWVWSFLGEPDEPELKKRWTDSIYLHCAFIADNFSRFSSANNHLIGEAAGLFIGGIVWDFGKQSETWRKKAFDILNREVDRQNYPDGVNKEQAISYQQFVLDFFLLAGLTGEHKEYKFPQAYWDRMEVMMEFIASVMDVKGNMPSIGDADDGYAVILSDEDEFNPYRSLLATGAVVFKRGDFKQKAGRFDEKSFWLLGEKGRQEFAGLRTTEYQSKKSFSEGGYHIITDSEGREEEIKIVFDCGPLGYLSLSAHGHADALSFTLSVDGREMLVDPGTYAYHTGKIWRDYFRGTLAHNTLRIDQQDQSVIGGNFMWLRKAGARLISHTIEEGNDILIGEHDGYLRLKDPVIHRRHLKYDRSMKFILLKDEVAAKEEHFIEQCFHFSEDCEVKVMGGNRALIRNHGRELELRFDKKLTVKKYKGSLDPILGWVSRRFDCKEMSTTLVNSGYIKGNSILETLIEIREAEK